MPGSESFRIIVRVNGSEVSVKSVGDIITFLDSLGVSYEFFIKRRL